MGEDSFTVHVMGPSLSSGIKHEEGYKNQPSVCDSAKYSATQIQSQPEGVSPMTAKVH